MEHDKIFSERLKEAMIHNNKMSQRELGKIVGLSEVTISRYTAGLRIPNATDIAKIAKALNVSSDYLLGLSDGYNGDKTGTINVTKALEYCEKCKESWVEFQHKALQNIGHGDSCSSSFGSIAYGAQQEEIYGYTLPNLIRYLGENL